MDLKISDDARVYIVTGAGAWPALPDLSGPAERPRASRPVLKTAGVAALVVMAFLAGQHTPWAGGSPAALAATQAGIALSRPPMPPIGSQRAFPVAAPSPPLGAPAADPAQVPPQFTQQLQQPPTVTPPPGQAPAAPPAASPFGLHE